MKIRYLRSGKVWSFVVSASNFVYPNNFVASDFSIGFIDNRNIWKIIHRIRISAFIFDMSSFCMLQLLLIHLYHLFKMVQRITCVALLSSRFFAQVEWNRLLFKLKGDVVHSFLKWSITSPAGSYTDNYIVCMIRDRIVFASLIRILGSQIFYSSHLTSINPVFFYGLQPV